MRMEIFLAAGFCRKWTSPAAPSPSDAPVVELSPSPFQRPVFVGDEVSCYAKILKVGHTSITVKVEAFARRGRSGKQIKVTEGIFTYVAINSESKPRPV
jgi:acyl-CoA thioesterase YciA